MIKIRKMDIKRIMGEESITTVKGDKILIFKGVHLLEIKLVQEEG